MKSVAVATSAIASFATAFARPVLVVAGLRLVVAVWSVATPWAAEPDLPAERLSDLQGRRPTALRAERPEYLADPQQ